MKDIDYTDPGYLSTLGFTKREIKEMLSSLDINTTDLETKMIPLPASVPNMARITSASDIPVMIGAETGFIQYDKDTGHKSTITVREKEEKAQEWRRRIQITDGDLDAFQLHGGKIDPPLDSKGEAQWAPVTSHPNLMGSPVKYMAEGSTAASTDYGVTSPQWPGKPFFWLVFPSLSSFQPAVTN